MKKCLCLLVMLISLAATSFAYVIELGDYHTSKESISKSDFKSHGVQYSICNGDYRIIPVLFRNDQKQNEKVLISLDGPGWIVGNGEGFILPPGKEGVYFIEIKPPADYDGNTSFILDTKSDNAFADVEIGLDVRQCYSLDISFPMDKDVVSECSPAEYTLEVKNLGVMDQEISVSFEGAIVTANNRSIGLKAGEEGQVIVQTGCLDPGSYDLRAFVNLGDMVYSDTLHIKVLEKVDFYSLRIGGKGAVSVYGDEAEVLLKVENKGFDDHTYSVRIEGPAWISTDKDEVRLGADEVSDVTLNIFPVSDVEFGKYPVKVVFSVGGVEYYHELAVNYKEENRVIKSIKDFVYYYRYYFYIAPLIIILFIVLFAFLRKSLSQRKEMKEERKKRRHEKKVKETVEVKYDEDKSEIKKESHKSVSNKKKNLKGQNILNKYYKTLAIFFGLIIISGVFYALFYFNWYMLAYDFFVVYWNYIVAGLVLLVVVILAMHFFSKVVTVRKK